MKPIAISILLIAVLSISLASTLGSLSSIVVYSSTENESSGSDEGSGSDESENQEQEKESKDEPPETEPEPEPQPEPQPPTDDNFEDMPEVVGPDLPICDGSPQDCYTNDGNICLEGQGGHECECSEDMNDCPNHPSLKPPKRLPLPYCDIMNQDPNWEGSCFDRRDYDEQTLLYPCNDGSQKKDWRDCPDITDPNYKPSPSHDHDKCKHDKDWEKCHKDHDRKDKVIKIIKNINIIKKISNSGSGGDNDNDIEQTIVAINYNEGAGINCVFFDDDNGQCETFDVTKDSGKEPLLQIIPFS